MRHFEIRTYLFAALVGVLMWRDLDAGPLPLLVMLAALGVLSYLSRPNTPGPRPGSHHEYR